MPKLTELSDGIEELRQAFNRDVDKPRLLMLVSPTCGPCRDGASVMQTEVLSMIAEPSLRAYVGWVPILPDDSEAAARESAAIVADRRAVQFWDGRKALPGPFAAVLGLPEGWPAWDVYLGYPAGVTWDDTPPSPAFWQHQLGPRPKAPILDAQSFREQLRQLIDRGAS